MSNYNRRLAAQIYRMAVEIDVQLGEEPTRKEYIESLFQGIQNQMTTLLEELKRGIDAPLQKVQINRIDQALDDLDMVWRDLEPALEANEVIGSTKGTRVAGLFGMYKNLYDAAIDRIDTLKRSVERRKELPDYDYHVSEIGKIEEKLEELWMELGQALEMDEGLLL